MRSQLIAIDKWRDIVNKGNGWKNEGDWAATSYDVCERTAIIKFPPFDQNAKVKIQFMFDIMTPQADSPYVSVILLRKLSCKSLIIPTTSFCKTRLTISIIIKKRLKSKHSRSNNWRLTHK
jgi:hypothetical protein